MAKKEADLTIAPPQLEVAMFKIRGVAPYVQNKFSAKAKMELKETAQSTGKRSRKIVARDLQQEYEEAKHISTDGWCGIPAPAFRAAMISACRLTNYTMTAAKLSFFVIADGFDADDATPLVKITKGEPQYHESMVRDSGMTRAPRVRARPMWAPGWEATLMIRFDAGQFQIRDVANLLVRAGMQVGIGEGRPDCKSSGGGMGWGLFEIVGKGEMTDA